MKTKFFIIGLLILFLFISSSAQFNSKNMTPVYENEAVMVANNFLNYINKAPLKGKLGYYVINEEEIISNKGLPLCYVFNLSPSGHIVLSAYKELNPLRSFSFYYSFKSSSGKYEKIITDKLKDEFNYLNEENKGNLYVTSTIKQNKKCWIFWKNFRLDTKIPPYELKEKYGREIKKQAGILLSSLHLKNSIKLQKGKLLTPIFYKKNRNRAQEEDKFINNLYVAKYYQHLHRDLQKKKYEAESINQEKVKIKSANISLLSGTIYSQSDVFGDFVLSGAVKNIGTSAAMFTEINVALYDKNNNLIGTGSTYINGGTNVKLTYGAYTNALLPGEKGFFILFTSYKYSEVDHWQYSFDWDEYSYSLCNAEIKFDGNPSFSSDYFGDLYIAGNMKNTAKNYVSYFTEVFFAIYNSSGKVINVDSTYVDGDTYNLGWTSTDTAIYPGQSWPFELYTITPYGNYSSYEYSFEWNEAQTAVLTYSISGKVVKAGGGGLDGVEMEGLPGNPTTNDQGQYSTKVESGWSGTVTPKKEGYSFSPPNRSYASVTSNKIGQDYTASYIQYTLTITSGTGGTTNPVPGTYTYDKGTKVTITALPDKQYVFYGWSGNVSGITNPITVTMNADKSITANFKLISPPANFNGQKVLNRSLYQAEYINVLKWKYNPKNAGINIVKYRIYQTEVNTHNQLVELNADVFEYLHRNVEKEKQYTYAIVAVNAEGREGKPAFITIN